MEANSQERLFFEALLMADWGQRQGEPVGADEILMFAGAVCEPLFHAPPVGPIPEHLDLHFMVHGCVAEYEDGLEDLDRWKALALSRWMTERVGKRWYAAGKVYELQAKPADGAASGKFWFRLVEDPRE